MDTAGLVSLARTKSREQFAAVLPNFFLLLSSESVEDPMISFRTVAVQKKPGAPVAPKAGPHVEIIEIVKAHGNPYPDRISIGRARNCDVVIRDPSVSKLHGHFRVTERRTLELIDPGSHN